MSQNDGPMWALVDVQADDVIGLFPLKHDAVRHALTVAGVPAGSPIVDGWCAVCDDLPVTREQAMAMSSVGLDRMLIVQVDLGLSSRDVWFRCMAAIYQPHDDGAGPASAPLPSVAWPF